MVGVEKAVGLAGVARAVVSGELSVEILPLFFMAPLEFAENSYRHVCMSMTKRTDYDSGFMSGLNTSAATRQW